MCIETWKLRTSKYIRICIYNICKLRIHIHTSIHSSFVYMRVVYSVLRSTRNIFQKQQHRVCILGTASVGTFLSYMVHMIRSTAATYSFISCVCFLHPLCLFRKRKTNNKQCHPCLSFGRTAAANNFDWNIDEGTGMAGPFLTKKSKASTAGGSGETKKHTPVLTCSCLCDPGLSVYQYTREE